MTKGLVRHHSSGDFHFLTWSCYGRKPHLENVPPKELFERTLESMRLRYGFLVAGYVLMPEHVHLLISEPGRMPLSKAIQAIKLSVSVQSEQRPFWQRRYYDFNVQTDAKHREKLDYMHLNPVRRGLVCNPGDWPWSSFRHYATGEAGRIEIESEWTASTRARAALDTHVSEARRGTPDSDKSP